jgi:transcriptional regulator with XRE-family HTH domain
VTNALAQELAQRVQRGMAAKGWTQKKLAEEAGTSEKHLSTILNGHAAASITMWNALTALTSPRAGEDPEARRIIEYGLQLRMYGERAPGGDETWREFDQMVEHYLRGLPVKEGSPRLPQDVSQIVTLRRKMEHFYRAAMSTNAEVIDTLAPVLGYEAFKPGEPGYSEDQVNWNVGDHTAESLAFEAAAKIEKLEGLVEELRSIISFDHGEHP